MSQVYVALKNLSQRFPPAILVRAGESFDASALDLSPSRQRLLVGLKAIRPATDGEAQAHLSQAQSTQE